MTDRIEAKALQLPTVRCNNCMTDWREDDLEGRNCAVDREPCQACPNCGTDHHLMDIGLDQGIVGTISTVRHPAVRYCIGHEGGDVFGYDSDYDGPTLTVEVADLDDARAMLGAISLRTREAEMRSEVAPGSEYDRGRRDMLNAILALNPAANAALSALHDREPDPSGKIPFDVLIWVHEVAAQLGIAPRWDDAMSPQPASEAVHG